MHDRSPSRVDKIRRWFHPQQLRFADDASGVAVQQGVEDFESLSAEQWTSLVEVFIAKSIEFRVFNDICNDVLGDALNVDQINAIQADLHDLIFGAVNGKLTTILAKENRMSNAALREAADRTYDLAFAYLEALGDE